MLKDAGLKNPEVCVIIALPVSFPPFTVVRPANIFEFLVKHSKQ